MRPQSGRQSEHLVASTAMNMQIIDGMMSWFFAMIKDIQTTRPARAAIAAVLAFSATPVLAQEIAPAAVAPVATPQIAPVVEATPAAPAAAAPVMAPAQPVVQATPSVEERKAEAIAQAEAAPAETAPSLAKREQRSTSASPSAPKAGLVSSVATAPIRVPMPAEVVPMEAAAVAPTESMTTPATLAPPVTNAAVQADNGNEALTWGLAGGALLLVGAVGTMAMRRRNRSEGSVNRVDDAAALQMPLPVAPVPEVALAREHIPPTPADPVVPAAASAREPLTAAAPHGSLAAMIDAPPSPSNPFLTRSNRLRRAHFLLARRAHSAVGAQTHSPTAAPQAAPVERPQIVYSFGKDGARRNGLIPRTR